LLNGKTSLDDEVSTSLLLDSLVSLELDCSETLELLSFFWLEDEDFALDELDDFAELLVMAAGACPELDERDSPSPCFWLEEERRFPDEPGMTEEGERTSSQSSQMLEDESSEERAETPLSSSPQAARHRNADRTNILHFTKTPI
jgi:hypothetical protein